MYVHPRARARRRRPTSLIFALRGWLARAARPHSRTPSTRAVVMQTPRSDGRASDEHLRALSVALDTNSRASGSSYVELGNTKVSCAVYGPRRPRVDDLTVNTGVIDVDVFRVPFARKRAIHVERGRENEREKDLNRSAADVELSARIADVLRACALTETFPRAQVDVYVTIMDSDGGEVVASVLAASAALARAGVEMADLASACELVRIGERLVLDPTEEECERGNGKVFLAQMSSEEGMVQGETFGRWTADESRRALEQCAAGCNRFDTIVREALAKS